ncbi:MAG TPA: ribosome biogenesis GTP-binding protein YihA/YsxC [Chlamydiales bacterium]|nr:ribosome biogenesis GTP-binding protein YihA/YsxC [Chlamydiales bacterium]
MLKNGRFLLSTLNDFPNLKDPRGKPLPEIAFAGRSNVGKSSLINHLLNQKGLAKTSSTPGKTQLLNFFSVDDRLLLVDLPGYGFAKAPPDAIQKWSEAIDAYLNHRSTLKLILLLIDCRREMGEEDRLLIDWAAHKKIPLLVILTKTDKLSPIEVEAQMQKTPQAIPYSIKLAASRQLLSKRIEQILWD